MIFLNQFEMNNTMTSNYTILSSSTFKMLECNMNIYIDIEVKLTFDSKNEIWSALDKSRLLPKLPKVIRYSDFHSLKLIFVDFETKYLRYFERS